MNFRKSHRFFTILNVYLKSCTSVIYLVVLSLTLINFNLFAQPALTWENAIGGTGYDELRCLQATPDGGMILACTSPSSELTSADITEPSNGAGDYWIVKIEPDGTIAWDRRIGGSDFESAQEIQATSDGGYIIGGFSRSGASGDKTTANYGPAGASDIWIAKLDATGLLQWERSYGGVDDEELYHIEQTADGGYILGGSSKSGSTGTKDAPNYGEQDFYVIKIDANGNQLWDQSFGGSLRDVVQGLAVGIDGSIYLGGYSESTNDGNKTDATFSPGKSDYWVVKTDALGNKIWDKAFGGDSWDQIRNVSILKDGNLLVGGFSKSGISGNKTTETFGLEDMWVLKLSQSGNVIWQQNYGGNLKEECTQVSETSCGELLLGGFSRSPISGNKTGNLEGNHDYWIVKIDEFGNKIWDESYGGDGLDVLYDFKRSMDGGFLMGGVSYSNGTGDRSEASLGPQDIWLLKLDFEPRAIDSTFISSSSCFPGDTGIIVNHYLNIFDCDSIVVDTVKYLTSDTTEIFETSCSPADTGTVVTDLFNINGCDSMVVIKTSYLASDTTEIFESSCSPLDTGEVVTYFFNIEGCDSLVITKTALIQSYEFNTVVGSCNPSLVGIDTTWFSAENGCDSLIIVETVLSEMGMQSFTKDVVCFDGNDGEILVEQMFGGTTPYVFALNNSAYFMDTIFNNLSAGTYFLSVLDSEGCELTQEIEVGNGQNFQLSNFPKDMVIALGDSILLDPLTNYPIGNFSWDSNLFLTCDTCLRQFVHPTMDTHFELNVISDLGCEASGRLEVIIDKSKNWYVPNAFSPNDDGLNDLFKIYFDQTVESIATIRIFNRWGGLVYLEEDISRDTDWGWDGEYKGVDLNEGIFVFIAEIVFADGTQQMLKGDVALMR